MMITIQLPDGTFAQKPIDALQPDDMIVFGDCETRTVEYQPQPMEWDFGPPQVVQEVGIPRPWKLRGPDHVIEYHQPSGLDWSDAQ